MVRWRLGQVVAAALAGFAASLSVKPHQASGPEATALHPQAYKSAICARSGEQNILQDGVEDSACDELIPRYNMNWWLREKGYVLPDHPAIFIDKSTKTTLGKFLQEFGSSEMFALPEYAQRNSHLKNYEAAGAANTTVRELLKSRGYLYGSDTRCYKDSLCHRLFGSYGIPDLFGGKKSRKKQLLIGGPGTGMPFHKHEHMWQGLSLGQKAWYILPPGAMSEKVHDLVGPYIFPVRAFHAAMRNLEVGERPLYCVQKPGMVMYIPDFWWHATMNMDQLQVAYGAKSMTLKQQTDSYRKANILKVFPQQKFDSAGWAESSSGPLKKSWPMPYALYARITHIRRGCGNGTLDKRYGLEEPLQRMLLLDGSKVMDCLHETVAYAHCALATALKENVLRSRACQQQLSQSKLHTLRKVAIRWLNQARAISSTLVQKEPEVCKRIPLKEPLESANETRPPEEKL